MAEAQVQQGMDCPVCRVDLLMTNRDGVEINYCPKCRGVWLDRGELDKIVERTSTPQAAGQRQWANDDNRHQQRGDYQRRGNFEQGNFDQDDPRQNRRGGWLDNLFDFGD